MSCPSRASSRAQAAPKPLDAPRMRAQPLLCMFDRLSVFRVASRWGATWRARREPRRQDTRDLIRVANAPPARYGPATRRLPVDAESTYRWRPRRDGSSAHLPWSVGQDEASEVD